MATREDDSPFGPTPDEEMAAADDPTGEQDGPTLEDAFEGAGDEEEAFAAGEGPAPEGPEVSAGEQEGEPAADEGSEPEGEEDTSGVVRYRDPETGTFISAEEAEDRGLEPEELQTEQEAAEEFFEGEGEGEGEEAPIDEEEGHSVVLEPGDQEEGIELVVDDPEVAERIEAMQTAAEEADQLRDEVAGLREAREEIQQDVAELQAIEEELTTDPVPFLMQHVGDDYRAEIVRTIIATDDDVFQEVAEDVETWIADPRERRVAKAEAEKELTQKTYERQERREQAQEVQRNATEIWNALETVAARAERGDRGLLFDDLRDDVAQYADEHERRTMSLEEIAEIPRVQRRLRTYGIEPEVVVELNTNGGRRDGPRRARGRNGREVVEAEPAGEREEELAEEAEKYRKHGERLRKAYARKKDAAASTGPGAGASTAGGEQEALRGATLDEAFDIAERRVGQGQ